MLLIGLVFLAFALLQFLTEWGLFFITLIVGSGCILIALIGALIREEIG